MERNFISATIITRNEARNIERCLNSLIGVTDEIIVVDSCSTDNTTEICRRYGAKVTERPFTGFGSQRQYATSLTNGRYVLSIDADEVLTEELRNSLIKLKADGFVHRGYAFNVVNFMCGKALQHSGMAPQWQTRLFDKRYAQWDLLDVGERLSFADPVKPCRLEGDLHHYRCMDFTEYEEKELRQAALKGRLLAAAGINASTPACWFRAAAAFVASHFSEAAFLDGQQGRHIAKTKFKTTLAAYRQARTINKEKQQGKS